MNSYLTNDSSCHSTQNAVPKQSLSTIEGQIKKAMFIFKIHMFLRVQTSHEIQKTAATTSINNLEAVQNDLNVEQIMTPDSTTNTSEHILNPNKNCLDIAMFTYAQRAITQQQSTMESNILNYEEDLENAYMLYSYIRLSQRLKNTSINQLPQNQDTASQISSVVEVNSQQANMSLFQQILDIYQQKELSIESCTKLMEALLNYRKNAIFYETYQDVVSRLTKDDCIKYQSELSTFFAQTARGIMLTKSAHKGSLMIKLMSEIGIAIHNENHLNPVIEGCFRSGKYHFVQEVINNSKSQDSLALSTLKILVKYYSKLNQTQLAMSYFTQLQYNESFVNDSTYVQSVNHVLDSLLKNEYFQEAEQLFNQTYMLSKDHVNCIDMMTFSCMIKAYCKIHKLNSALNVLTLMRECNIIPDEVLYNSLIDGCSKNNQLNKAFQIYDDMIADGVIPSTITFNTLIDCCVRSGHQDKAWEVLEQMKAKQVKSDNYTYSTLFKGIKCENQKQDLEKAFSLYKQLQESNDFTPDEILFNVLLDACINCKQLDRAVELFKQLKNYPTPTTSSEQPKIEINLQKQNESLDLDSPPCVKQDQQDNKADTMLPTISQFQPQEQQSFIRPDEISFNTIIKGCAQEKKLSLAFEMFNLMKQQPNLKPNDVTYNSLIDACVRCGKMSSAWQLLNEMQTHNIVPDNFTYSTLIKGIRAENQSQNGIISNPMDLEKAFDLLEQMKHSSSSSTVKPDEILYNCLIDACVRFHDVNRAVAVFQEMQLSNIKPSSVTYGILIKAYGQANQLDNAFFVFRKMKESSLIPNSVTYGCLIDACVKNNQIDKAMEVFETMKRDGVQLNTIIFTTLIKGFAKSFKLDQALEVYEIMKIDDKIRPNNVTYNSLIDCCIRCNSIQKAMEIFNEMKQPSSLIKPDLITYSTMIKGFCREKNIQQALIILNDMEKQNIVADEVLYNSLLDGCCKANEIDMALKVYRNMEILKIKPSNVTYSILVKIYGKQRNLPKALGVLEEMKKDGIKPGLIVYTCLLQTCIKSRQLKTAEQLFHDMRIQGLRGDVLTYQTMINGCLQFQKFDIMLLSLLKDASDTNVPLPHEITQNILAELNKWNTDDQKLKQDITQQVLAYMDNQKLNNSYNHFSQNHSQSFYNNQNHKSFRHINNNNSINIGTHQSFYQGNNNSQSFISEQNDNNNNSKNEYKNNRKGFFNSSRQNIQQQSTLSELQNKTQTLGSQEQTTKQTIMMMSVNDFTTPNQLSDLSAINHKQSNEKPNDEDEFVISSFNPSGTTINATAIATTTQQKNNTYNNDHTKNHSNNQSFNNKSAQNYDNQYSSNQYDKSYTSHRQAYSNHHTDRSYQSSGYNKQQQQHQYKQYDYEGYENYDNYPQHYHHENKSRNYDQGYYNKSNKSSSYYENSNNSQQYSTHGQYQQPNTQQVFGKHQKQHNKGGNYKKQHQYESNNNNNNSSSSYYDKENYHPNKQVKHNYTQSQQNNYHSNTKINNYSNNNYHNYQSSYGYNQGYY